MKNIVNVKFHYFASQIKHISIECKKKDYSMRPKDVGGIHIGKYVGSAHTDTFTRKYTEFSKQQLLGIQNILLQAYVFSHDKLEEAIEDNDSKKNLEELKEKILVIRTHLKYITKYIDDYDEMKNEFKDV
ncbi:hypothetical protein [Algibacter sp. L4_22]|uniref:hypothetical protein n=1 Tax=Algibacter sp. L4_22 TaxID=2942477 RepID=UPI00201B5461|nr:hypothetical protein [Algibacter sp. L4_22]MCL5127306.1 hypothetical protein [Algibacter sp. L4_22]